MTPLLVFNFRERGIQDSCFESRFRLGKAGLDAFQKEMIVQVFGLTGMSFRGLNLSGMVKNDRYSALCNTQQLTNRRWRCDCNPRHDSAMVQLVVRQLGL
jgi:hypothetical protein